MSFLRLVHHPPVLVPHDDISKMAAPTSFLFSHRGTNFFLFTGALVFKMSWKRRIFTSLAEAAFVCLLAQIRFEKWLECDCRSVGKQCALLFSGSVAFNQCNAGGCWEKETVAREMEGESESMISPSACFSSVSCRSSDPFVMLSHGEIWLGSLPSSQNWHGKSKGWGLCCSSLWMDHNTSIVTIRNVWPSAEALPI